jgi:hypothetical protein
MSIIPSLAASNGEFSSGRDQLGSARISGTGGVRISGTRTPLAAAVLFDITHLPSDLLQYGARHVRADAGVRHRQTRRGSLTWRLSQSAGLVLP